MQISFPLYHFLYHFPAIWGHSFSKISPLTPNQGGRSRDSKTANPQTYFHTLKKIPLSAPEGGTPHAKAYIIKPI